MATEGPRRQAGRTQNKRGEGARLRASLMAAAGEILEATGDEEAITLRAVARRAGVSAPAIYAHFDSPEDILLAVVRRTFSDLASALRTAYDAADEPSERLLAVSRAYLDFAGGRPHHYRVLFQRHRRGTDTHHDTAASTATVDSILGADAFAVFRDAVGDAVAAGTSHPDDPVAAATRVWVGLHGQAALAASLPWFPWPDRDTLMGDLVVRLADLTDH